MKTKSAFLVKYTFLEWDNYQGASGEVYNSSAIVYVNENTPIDSIYDTIEKKLIDNELHTIFRDNIKIISIKLLKVIK